MHKMSINNLIGMCVDKNEKQKLSIQRTLDKVGLNENNEIYIKNKEIRANKIDDVTSRILINAKLFYEDIEQNKLSEQLMTKWIYDNIAETDIKVLLDIFGDVLQDKLSELRIIQEETGFIRNMLEIIEAVELLKSDEEIDYRL